MRIRSKTAFLSLERASSMWVPNVRLWCRRRQRALRKCLLRCGRVISHWLLLLCVQRVLTYFWHVNGSHQAVCEHTSCKLFKCCLPT